MNWSKFIEFSLSFPSLLFFFLDPSVKQKNHLKEVRVQVAFSDPIDTREFKSDSGKAGMRNVLESTYQTNPETDRQGWGEVPSWGLENMVPKKCFLHDVREMRSDFWLGVYVCIDTRWGLITHSHPFFSAPTRQPLRGLAKGWIRGL